MTLPQSNSCSHPETADSLPATTARQPESADPNTGLSAEVLSEQPPSNASLQQQLERERLISRIALQVFQSSDLSVILKAALDEIRQFLQADRVAIERCWREGETTTVADSVGPSWQPSPGKHRPDGYGSHWHNGQRSDTAVPNSKVPAAACLSLPILRNGQPWGALLVYQGGEPRPWDAAEVQLLEQLTTQLAIAIHHSELHQEIQRLNDHLESEVQARTLQLQQAYEFEATLKRITDRVRDSLDVDLILQAAVRELAIVMKVRGCNASLYDLEEGTSTTCYEYTNSLSPYQGRISKFSAAQELYSQLLKGQYFQFCSLIPNPERGMVAMLACPILDDQGVIGDLWVIHHCDHAFGEQDIRLVQQVANQCAIALRQAHLYSEVQAEVRALERLNQLKDDFLSTVSHELRTPLSNIKMAIHMLRTAPTAERQQRYLQILEAECSRETELINDLLDLQRLENESYSVSPEPIQLQEWLPTILAPFLSRAQSRQQHLHVELPDDQPPLSSDRKSLERILAELLNNACKYTSPNGSIALHVKYDPQFDARQLHLKGDERPLSVPVTTFVISNQADIPATEVPRMFEKFYRIPKSDPWQQGGTGLGLALVKKLVETLQGTIHADSYNGWTILTVHFPMLPAIH
ncbi:MAG: GAF domain-containing sensor histidine kinase [Synechococcales cyanobacterium M58_A2018_015]|nr:GAF domain-containing sensor histidine kinase [Synechococcales cyanobacterium M58_A2018_015]